MPSLPRARVDQEQREEGLEGPIGERVGEPDELTVAEGDEGDRARALEGAGRTIGIRSEARERFRLPAEGEDRVSGGRARMGRPRRSMNSRRISGGRAGRRRQKPVERPPDDLAAAAAAVFGGDEVIADPEREGEQAAGLDLVLSAQKAPRQRRACSPSGGCRPAAGGRPTARSRRAQSRIASSVRSGSRPAIANSRSQLLAGVAALALDPLDHVVDDRPFPAVEHRCRAARRRSSNCQ